MKKMLRSLLLRQIGEAAAQEERNRLARDLHDSIKQQLFSINVGTATAQERWERDPEGAKAALVDVRRSAKEAMVEMQALLHQLRPEALTYTGLVEALREQCEALGYRTGAEVTLELGEPLPDDHLPPGTQETLFRIAQEALANVARHARAREVRVWLGRDGGSVRIWVRDDGQGFDPDSEASGMGLRNIRERTKSFRGNATVASEPGAGTTVDVWIPLTSPQEVFENYGTSVGLSMAASIWIVRAFNTGASRVETFSAALFTISLVITAIEARRRMQSALGSSSGLSQASLAHLRHVSHRDRAMAFFLAAGWTPFLWRFGEIWNGWTIIWLVAALVCMGLTVVELVRLHRVSGVRQRWWRVSRFRPTVAGRVFLWVFLYFLAFGALMLFLPVLEGWRTWSELRPQPFKTVELVYLLLGAALLLYLRSRRPASEESAK